MIYLPLWRGVLRRQVVTLKKTQSCNCFARFLDICKLKPFVFTDKGINFVRMTNFNPLDSWKTVTTYVVLSVTT